MNTPLIRLLTLVLVLVLVLGACTSTPRRSPAIEDARGAQQRALSKPDVQRHAADELAQALADFAAAERAWSAREPASRVDPLAYMASRRFDIAEAAASSRAARIEAERAAAERNRLRLALRSREADSARRTADAAHGGIASLEGELAGLNAHRSERGLVVTLGDVLFDTGRSKVRPEGDADLRRIAEVLRGHPGYQVVIEGHTDDVGRASSNFLLSERRADAVMRSLIEFGAPAGQMVSRGHGQEFPSASNDTASGRQMNRRVEVVINDDAPAAAGR
jgi:outer membrane protein OmpA-like peptidoglycan-associated protein